jgi:hypothetical protein
LDQVEAFLEDSAEIEGFRFVNDVPIPYLRGLVLQKLTQNANVKGVNGIPGAQSRGAKGALARREFAKKYVGKYYLLEPGDLHIAFVIIRWGEHKQAAIVYPTPLNRKVCNLSESLVYENQEAVDFWDKNIFEQIFKQAKDYCYSKEIDPSLVFRVTA